MNRDAEGDACDFGCGVGHYLPELAKRFKRVDAIDLSPGLLGMAKRSYKHLDNIRFFSGSLTQSRLPVRRARFAVCANVLIMPSEKARRAILGSIHRNLKPGGRLLLVVPATESALFVNQRLVEWNRRKGFTRKEAMSHGIQPSRSAAKDILNGVFENGGEPTKHYLRQEMITFLGDTGFKMLEVDRVEYEWDTEFEDPPGWMNEAGVFPWDWMFVAERD
ncbi:MAG: class I SAM-dependent methyltransferase [Planctomycetota bacterium]